MYKNAYEKKPDSEDILNALFMAYVRIGNYKKQQQIAMALHKLRPLKNPYYFWAVMSIVMQVGAVLYVTHLHKTSCKLENSVSRYWAKALRKAFFPIDTLLQILILIYFFYVEKEKVWSN